MVGFFIREPFGSSYTFQFLHCQYSTVKIYNESVDTGLYSLLLLLPCGKAYVSACDTTLLLPTISSNLLDNIMLRCFIYKKASSFCISSVHAWGIFTVLVKT